MTIKQAKEKAAMHRPDLPEKEQSEIAIQLWIYKDIRSLVSRSPERHHDLAFFEGCAIRNEINTDYA